MLCAQKKSPYQFQQLPLRTQSLHWRSVRPYRRVSRTANVPLSSTEVDANDLSLMEKALKSNVCVHAIESACGMKNERKKDLS